MVTSSSENIVVVGNTSSSDFPTTSGTYDNTIAGSNDAFISIFGTITSVEERPSAQPYSYTLEGNLLKVKLNEPAYVGLNIYPADGRLLDRASLGYLVAGTYTVGYRYKGYNLQTSKVR